MRRPYKHIDLNDKFSDFEHTPEDSSWNTISGGINSRQSPGNLSNKMDDLSVPPGSSVWSGIASQIHPNRKKKAILWWNYGAAASLISAVLLASLVFSSSTESATAYTPRDTSSGELVSWDENYSNEEEFTNTSDNETRLTDASEEIKKEFQDEETARNTSKSPDRKTLKKQLTANKASQTSGDRDSANGEVENLIKQVIEASDVLYSSTPEENSPYTSSSNSEDTLLIFRVTKLKLEPRYYANYSTVDVKDNLAVSTFPFWLTSEDGSVKPNKKGKSTSLLAMTQLNQSSSSTSDGMSLLASNTPQSFIGIADESLSLADAENSAVTSNEKFSTPLYFSLNLEKELSIGRRNRWSAGSGLGYLLMRSSTSYESEEISSITDIKRNYIAVPLYLKYNFIKKPRWSSYASLGSSAEFGLGGKAETNDFRNDELENSSSSKFNLGVGQFNASTSIGFNIKLSTHLTAFSEASVAHYFYQSNYNLWSSKKLWPGLKTGLSLRF